MPYLFFTRFIKEIMKLLSFLCLLVALAAPLRYAHAVDLSFLDSPEWNETKAAESPQYVYSSMNFKADDVWYESNYYQGSGWCKIGKTWMHPGDNQQPALTFTAPQDGQIVLEGNPKKLHVAKGTDGVRAAIFQNDEEIWSAEIGGDDAVGKSYRLERTVQKGDAIRFLVEPRQSIVCDTTGWDPVIVYKNVGQNNAGQPDWPTFLASRYFAEKPAADCPFSWQTRTRKQDFELPPVAVSPEQIAALKQALRKANANGLALSTDVRLWRLQLTEWVRDDKLSSPQEIADATQKHAERAEKLLKNLYPRRDKTSERFYKGLDDCRATMAAAKNAQSVQNAQNAQSTQIVQDELDVYMSLRIFKRDLAFSNPLLKFGKLLFVKRKPSSYSHITMQFNGWRAQKGGGLFVLENPGQSLECRDLLDGQFEDGNVLEPNLSFDGKTILFAGVHCSDRNRFPWQAFYPDQTNEQESDHSDYYHLYRINAD